MAHMLGSVIQLKGSSSGDGPMTVGFADPAGGTGGGGGNDLPFDATVYLNTSKQLVPVKFKVW